MKPSNDATLYLAGTIAVIGIIGATYLGLVVKDKNTQINTLLLERNTFLQQSNQKTAELAVASTTIEGLQKELIAIKDELENLADDYKDERNRNEEFEDQIRDLAGTLGDLDKLAKTDTELLAKYSKVYFLNENYTPERLKQIDEKFVLPGKGDLYFLTGVTNHLEEMFEDAADDGIHLKIVSAYRSFDHQTELKGQYMQVYGSGANTFSADQGYSEHQLGTTVDITTPDVGGTYGSFAATPAYQWLLDNGYKYGFILSYPENNSFYMFEPWHWRYVGVDLARDLHDDDKSFYTLDQREIDQYLIKFFE